MRNLFRILVIKGINWCVFICCINFAYLNCQPYCLFIVTLDTPTLCLCKVYSKHEYIIMLSFWLLKHNTDEYVLFTQKHITLNDIIVIFVDNYDFSLAFDLLQ